MTDLCSESNETRDALIEERKQDIIHQRMEDEEIVREAIETIMDDNVRTGVIDKKLCDFFMQCNRTRFCTLPYEALPPEHQKEVLDAASSLFNELFERIYYDVLEDDALAQAKKEIDKIVNQPSAC